MRPQERVKSTVLTVVQTEKPNTGIVERIGPKVTGVKPGDRVRFGTGEGYLSFPPFFENGREFLVMQEADVCFVEE